MPTRKDTFHHSRLDHETWAKRMVDEGKMYYPETRNVSISIPPSDWNLKLTNIFCEGSNTNYDIGKDKFCGLMTEYASSTLVGGSYFLQDALCDSDACDLFIDIGATAAGYFIQEEIDAFCIPAFEALRGECNQLGGVASLDLVQECGPGCELGTKIGYFQSMFYVHDSGATCPADTPETVCRVEEFA